MFLARPGVKWLLAGLGLGVLFVLVVEWCGIIILARMHKKNPQELAQQLVDPPIPSSLDADFGLKLEDLDGKPFDLGTLKGRVIVLSFWNPDCAQCLAELPSIQHLSETVSNDKIRFVLVSVTGKADDIRSAAAECKLTIPLYRLTKDRKGAFGTNSVPATFIVDSGGKIAFRHEGPARWDGANVSSFLKHLAE